MNDIISHLIIVCILIAQIAYIGINLASKKQCGAPSGPNFGYILIGAISLMMLGHLVYFSLLLGHVNVPISVQTLLMLINVAAQIAFIVFVAETKACQSEVFGVVNIVLASLVLVQYLPIFHSEVNSKLREHGHDLGRPLHAHG